jgi:hypothetical protein
MPRRPALRSADRAAKTNCSDTPTASTLSGEMNIGYRHGHRALSLNELDLRVMAGC